ncbi:N-terminal Xaa-Pro-Lys N-methyltransferase 1 [Neocloeon triangulifer]|uniref:N-terminal Xaa-Pro-Lys N-methyltransferase 1 n=1 Tax=Neocloeon triangulifer TaxID=2078957 RepID=UPI00286EFE54|nr:N-terminal Xaa-Pro-Lys N-methyltransferase 1 [Neocloeon triangulifer]
MEPLCKVIPAAPAESNVTAAWEHPAEKNSDDQRDEKEECRILQPMIADENSENYYSHAATYWSSVPPTVDGMLGGFGYISHTDIQGSETFLKSVFKLKTPPQRQRALDCGAGIGRVTKLLLQRFFDKVDLVEQNPAFLKEAKTYLGPSKHVGQMYCEGLQNFKPEESYDVIWCQWVLGQLKDHDFVEFMKANIKALKPSGVIVVKENVSSSGETEEDTQDASVTRSEKALVEILTGPSGLRILREMKQPRFPKGLFPVRMYAMRPCKKEDLSKECE